MNASLVDVGFWLCAVVSVVAGALVFYVDSMARATYALAVSFVAVGVTLLAREARRLKLPWTNASSRTSAASRS